MFCSLFGWKKASKCKKQIALLQSRLKLLKRKRYSIVRRLREDIALLLRNGRNDCVLVLVEKLYKDQSLLDAYDQLDQFCEFIMLRFSYIRRHKDRPDDINEAISTLIFAAARCGDLPELQVIKKLFGDRYGHKYVNAAAEFYSGSLVKLELTEKLCLKSVPEDAKLRALNEIVEDYCLQPWNQGSANTTEPPSLQLQVWGDTDCQLDSFVITEDDSKSNSVPSEAAPCIEHSPQAMSKFTIIPLNMVPERTCSDKLSAATFYEKEDIRITETRHWEVLSQSHKRSVYLGGVEEVQYSDVRDQYGDDKTIFLFNLYIPSLIGNSEVHRGEVGERSSVCQASGASCSGSSLKKSNPCKDEEKVINVQTARRTIKMQKRLEAMNPEKHLQSDPSKSRDTKGSTAASRSHVHPKLPDYDELVATFRALKQEHLQRNKSSLS